MEQSEINAIADRISEKLIKIVKEQLAASEPTAGNHHDTPEMNLILRIVANWGNAVAMPNMEGWLREYAQHPTGTAWVTGQYDRLYDQAKGGMRKVCYVDYRWTPEDEPCRDICTIRADHMDFSARGISYGGVAYMGKNKNEKIEFIKECERLNVQWLDEHAQPVDDWISVEDKLPEVGEYVMVYNTEGATLIGRLMSNGWTAIFSDGDNFMGELTATHWRPLPPPPKPNP